ncbi:DNA-methyltransferase [Companilactobacillus mishanensis]|uniref:Methyltransferase n=1 Tax=Companilactobacillus mishanensis TaxID=2486008 RepID=A0A5P0ZI50_9LACO|nr:site-specific DNA-methyltransferase [Companilactobacillus mishanensis]MQS52724.1 site-specific DNA-methyltransferase [Companilactobacillus mishanensis]MQS89572.1 site-specific DNA-methyltransferase [Companilactobacillus mishanensis]
MEQVYKDEYVKLVLTDTFEFMETLPEKSIDVIIADPPYFLSNDGISNSGGKVVSVNKGKWDKKSKKDAEEFYKRFLELSFKVLKDDGTIWVFGTMHNIYTVGYLMQHNQFKIINNVTWHKSNPAPNLTKRMLTHSSETILWAKKNGGKQIYNYSKMKEHNHDRQLNDLWTTSTTSMLEKSFGYHPTQKPLAVMKRIIEASTNKDSLLLDPFIGSGTTAVAAKQLGRRIIGIDNSQEFIDLSKKRILGINKAYIGKIE